MKTGSRARRFADLDWYLFTVVAVGIALPYVVHIPGIPFHDAGWFDNYFVGPAFVFNLVPVLALVALRAARPRRDTAFRCAVWFTFVFLGSFHGILDLAADPLMGLALFTIPVLAVGVAIVGFLVGMVAEYLGNHRGA